mmetsp:Transcript_10536/g.34802  ORF Transcript_10536/g.34802 Transcript_10536/m.34802 type:complete len:118 (-) Transcript_10536:45-398(-)
MRGTEKVGERHRAVVADHRHPFSLERRMILAFNASGLVSLVDMPRPPPTHKRRAFRGTTGYPNRHNNHTVKLATTTDVTLTKFLQQQQQHPQTPPPHIGAALFRRTQKRRHTTSSSR